MLSSASSREVLATYVPHRLVMLAPPSPTTPSPTTPGYDGSMRSGSTIGWAAALALLASLSLPLACSADDDPLDDCGDGQVATFEANGDCGRSGEEADCASIGCSVSGETALACGCDGVVYDSDCAAYQAGFDLDDGGSCAVPADRFACGPLMCLRDSEYCEERTDPGERSDYDCPTVPSDCMPAACDCLDIVTPRESSCSDSGDGLVVVID